MLPEALEWIGGPLPKFPQSQQLRALSSNIHAQRMDLGLPGEEVGVPPEKQECLFFSEVVLGARATLQWGGLCLACSLLKFDPQYPIESSQPTWSNF